MKSLGWTKDLLAVKEDGLVVRKQDELSRRFCEMLKPHICFSDLEI